MKVRQSVVIPVTDKRVPATFYSFDEFDMGNEHLLIKIHSPTGTMPEVPTLRIHSECLTGDVFHSSRCDCGPQLQEALKMTAEEGGYVAYLRQEGRGIGLYNKLDAYKLQDVGMDTYEANRHLGFENDARSFDMVADMLKAVDVTTVNLLSNNPKKELALVNSGIDVIKRVSTSCFVSPDNLHYLQAKVDHECHSFSSAISL